MPTIDEDAGLVIIPFTVSDDVVAPSEVTVTATSLNQTLLPAANLSIVGTGAVARDSPDDGAEPVRPRGHHVACERWGEFVHLTFTMVVNPVNDAPTISAPIAAAIGPREHAARSRSPSRWATSRPTPSS